jgi:hypothetical protein
MIANMATSENWKKKPYSTHYFVGCNLLGVKKCNNKGKKKGWT